MNASSMTFLDTDESGFAEILAADNLHMGTDIRTAVGSGADIPFPDQTFDFVTCQTLLVHVPNAKRVIEEMVRVTKREGTVVCVEFHGLANCAAVSSIFLDGPPNWLTRHFEFWTSVNRGRLKLGLGDANIGERLPQLLIEANLTRLSVHTSDKALPLIPPYETSEQHIILREELAANSIVDNLSHGMWSDHETRTCLLEGGGDTALYDAYLADVEERRQTIYARIIGGTYVRAGGRLLYLVSGKRT